MTAEKIKIVIVKPGQRPVMATIENDLRNFQYIVNGRIETTTEYHLPGMLVVCNDEGKNLFWRLRKDGIEDGNNPYRPNREINKKRDGNDWIFGTFFVIGNGEDDFVGLTDKQIKKAMYRFRAFE